MTEKLNIKVFLGDSLTPEDFSFSLLSTKTGSIFPTGSNDLFFSSLQNISFQTVETETERVRVLTNQSVFSQNIKSSTRATKPEDIRTTFNNNIITVLFFLFPAFLYSTPNIHNSFDDKVPHSGVAKINAPVLKKNRKVATPEDGIVYYKGNTVVQLTWKNDVFNVPEFQQLFSEIYKFYVWSKNEGIQKLRAGLLKIVENLADTRNGIATALENNEKNLNSQKNSKPDNYSSSLSMSEQTITEIWETMKKLRDYHTELFTNYKDRLTELINEKKEKKSTEITGASKKIYDEKQEKIVMKISEQINVLKYFDTTYNQNTSRITPVGSIVKGTIENFSSLIANRSVYDVLEKNEYIFKTDDPLPKNQLVLYDNLAKYPEYTKMVDAVAKFRGIVVKTLNPELDRLCNDFFNNTNRDLLYFILHIQKNFLYSTRGKTVLENSFSDINEQIAEQGRNSANLYYVGGITQRSNNTLLIYIGLDVIRGKVTTINQDKLKKCLFGNERLGNLFTELIETVNRATVKNYFYDVMADGSIVVSGNVGQPSQQPPQNEIRKGGKTRKHNKRPKRRRIKKSLTKKQLIHDNVL